MIRRALSTTLLLAVVLLAVSCSHKNKKVTNPIANVNSAQPDKVLFDRAMDAMQHGRYDVARLSLQTMINTYPDSEYVARAKLAVGDSWYAEGGSAGLAQAEIEYKDFITFFPNMPEAAEAQLKVANIHFRQMEKPDRDFTHAKRAEEEYKQLIQQFPDSKLVPEAKQRLREVQEVLAEREFRIGHFYYVKESWAAAIARFKSLVDTYPLYSGADDTLYLLGQANERLADRVRALKDEAVRAKEMKYFEDEAADAYSRILTRYPAMGRAKDARARLEAMHRPVPKATPEALARNQQEEQSRREMGNTFSRLMVNFHRRPNVSQAAKVGEPTLVPPRETSAPDVAREAQRAVTRPSTGGTSALTVQPVGAGAPPPANQPVPRAAGESPSPADTAIPELKPVGEAAQPPTQVPQPAPAQVNEASSDSSSANAQQGSSSSSTKGSNDAQSSSKAKKKKKKLLIF